MAIIDIVRFDGLKSRDWLIYKYPSEDLVFGTQLIVQEGQIALFVSHGAVADIFYPGTYTLTTENLPVLRSLVNLPFGGKTPFSAEVYFINTTVRLDINWGTTDPIQLIDPKYYVKLRIRAFGQMGLRVLNAATLFKNVIGGMQKADIVKFDKIKDYYRGILVIKVKSAIADAIINNNISALEISARLEALSASVMEQILPEFEKYGFSIGMPKVSSWVIASLLGACTAQAGIQPVLAAKDIPTAHKACIITAFVAAPFGLFTATLGMVAKVMSYNGTLVNTAGEVVTSGKLALSTLMMHLPPIAGGIVLASILAAILSTVSPLILASGTMVTKDLYQGVFNPNANDTQVLKVSRITTALSGVLCAGAAIILNTTGVRVLDIVYFAYSMRGALFVVVLLGIYYKKTSQKGAIYGMFCTAFIGGFWVIYNAVMGHFPIHPAISETYASVVVAFFSTLFFSHVFPRDKE